MARGRRAAGLAIVVAVLGSAGCSGEGAALPRQTTSVPSSTTSPSTSAISTTSLRPSTTVGAGTAPSTTVQAVNRDDPVAVGTAFIEAWRARDEAGMLQLARDPDLVRRALLVQADTGTIVCRPLQTSWQCTLGTSATPHFILLDKKPTWAVHHWGEAHDEGP